MNADMQDRRPIEPDRGDGTGRGERSVFRMTPQAVLGGAVVVVGLALLAENLGLADADRILRLWPLAVMAVGVTKLLAPQARRSSRVFGGLLTLAGGALAAERIFGLPIDFDAWWPLVLIGFGVLLLSRAMGRGGPGASAAGNRDSYFSEFATWAGKQRRVTSPAFRGADLTAVMGGVEVDLRGAGAASGGAVIDVFVMWGGIEIWVPPDWAVVNDVTVLMGGVEDKSVGNQAATHSVTIRGVVIMGGLEIKS